MRVTVKKIVKTLGIIALSLISILILFWFGLSICSTLNIPEANQVDYIKGVWIPVPPDWFTAYKDLDRMKEDGINTVSIGPFALNHAMSIIQRPFVAQFVNKAHQKGMAVHIAVNCWGPGFDTHNPHPEMKDLLTKEALYWAEFSEKHNVEFFSPQNEGDVVLGRAGYEDWAQEILPQIREIYAGKVVLKVGNVMAAEPSEVDYTIRIESFDPNGAFDVLIGFPDTAGYDYLMIDIFPPDHLEDNEKFLGDLERILLAAQEEVEKKNIDGVMIGEFGYPLEKPGLSASIMPGPISTPEEQAEYIDGYLETVMPLADGVIYCGWSMQGYGFKDEPAEDVIKEWFTKY
ncbi:MAG: hypothetical protein U9Q67_00775 [Patescibacteria group bacterium]|nr:hypothetical protein [Patescibacteria group bacterium]